LGREQKKTKNVGGEPRLLRGGLSLPRAGDGGGKGKGGRPVKNGVENRRVTASKESRPENLSAQTGPGRKSSVRKGALHNTAAHGNRKNSKNNGMTIICRMPLQTELVLTTRNLIGYILGKQNTRIRGLLVGQGRREIPFKDENVPHFSSIGGDAPDRGFEEKKTGSSPDVKLEVRPCGQTEERGTGITLSEKKSRESRR